MALKDQLTLAQNHMNNFVDLKCKELEFEIGDVFLKLCPFCQVSLAWKCCKKLAPKFFGPYQIMEHVGHLGMGYLLALPPEATIHPVLHVSQSK